VPMLDREPKEHTRVWVFGGQDLGTSALPGGLNSFR
jgi:hypothetical protein